MRDLILKMAISIDGFVSDLDGRNTWMFGADQEAKAWGVDYIWNASLHIMGSRSFDGMAAYWQTSTDQFAPPMNQIPKAVFSRQGPAVLRNVKTTAALDEARALNAGTGQSAEPQPGAGSWAEAYVASGDLAEEIAKLKAQEDRSGKPIIAHGGVSFARSLVAQGLVRPVRPDRGPRGAGQRPAAVLRIGHADASQAGELEGLSGGRGGADLWGGVTRSERACVQQK